MHGLKLWHERIERIANYKTVKRGNAKMVAQSENWINSMSDCLENKKKGLDFGHERRMMSGRG